MNKKIIGIFLFMLLILTTLSAVGNTNEIISSKSNILNFNIGDDFVLGELIVKFTDDSALSNPSITSLNKQYQVTSIRKIFKDAENTELDCIYFLTLSKNSNIISVIEDYSSNQYVVYAEPNYIGELPIIPNDEYFTQQWALNNSGQFGGTTDADIDAVEAWDIDIGVSGIIIASVDSGVDYNHEDIADNIWHNEDEIANNGIDDDENGYIDDVVGWDFCDNDSDPMDEFVNPQFGHGTRCAGVHSAISNNALGVAGVSWNCKTMVLRCFMGYYNVEFYAKGIKYAADNGADIINIEMAIPADSNIIEDAVNYAYDKGCYLVAAAGNTNTDAPHYPAAYEVVTSVGATNQRDERCDEDDWGLGRGSNYGEWLDVAAPGNSLWLLHPNNAYNFMSGGGTSLSAPFVAGLAALLLSSDPTLSPDEVKEIICDEDNVDPVTTGGYYIGSGRINAHKVLLDFIMPDLECYGGLNWIDIKRGETVMGNFTVENIGDSTSLLDWNIQYSPEWGTWSFVPDSGIGLTPEDGPVTVQLNCIVPDEKGTYKGKITIVNLENQYDKCYIDAELTVPKNKAFIFNFPFLNWLFDRFLNAFPLLKNMLGF
jgi:subtilisin family serine protease